MLLLKLHGSLNWRVPLGYAKPSPLEVVRHHEEWSTAHPDEYRVPAQFVESVLEQEPVIIPPVLSKSSLMEQPILRFLWSRAYEALAEAKHVVFIGYSMPTTDISTGYLFREGLRHVSPEKDITVVDYAGTAKDVNDKQPLVHAAYKKVFPKIGESQIVLSGAKSWILDNLTEWLFDSKGQPVAFLFGKNVISCDGRFIGAMIDSTIVWGEGEDGLSPYVGEVESGRLVVRSGEISSAKHVCVKPQTSPRVPSQVPPQVDPITLREGLRDFELSASPT